MAYLVIPSKRTRQPQGPFEVIPYAGVLPAVWLATNPKIQRGAINADVTCDVSRSVSQEGQSIYFDGTYTTASLAQHNLAGVSSATFMVIATPVTLPTGTNEQRLISVWDVPAAGNFAFFVEWYGSNIGLGIYGTNGAVECRYGSGAGGLIANGKPSTCVLTWSSNRTGLDRHRCWINGIPVGITAWVATGDAPAINNFSSLCFGVDKASYVAQNQATHLHAWATLAKDIGDAAARELSIYPYASILRNQQRRLYFGASGGGATIITSSGAASLLAKAAAAVAATKTTTTVARSAVAGTAATTSIRVGTAVAKAASSGTATATTLRTATIAARTTTASTAVATSLRTGIAAGRIASNAATTYAAIAAGAFAAAGRTTARGTAAYASTHTATAAATATTSGAAAATTLREGIAVARVDARAAVTAAALVAGTITTTAAAQISARASVSNTTERSAALAAMLALRGANPAAPELPVIVPPSTRTLSPDHTRLGLSPVAPAKPRLG